MAWKKWRGTEAKGKYHAYWTERDGTNEIKRSKKLSRDEGTANRMLRAIERNLELHGVGLGSVVTVAELATRYSAHLKANNCADTYIERVRIVLAHVERLFPGLRLPFLTVEKLDKYKATRLAEGIEGSTLNRELGYIKSAVKKGRRWKYAIPDLADLEKPLGNEKAHMPYTMADVTSFLEKAPALVGIVLRIGIYAGLRRVEMLALKWSHIDWEQMAIIVGRRWRTKTRKPRAVPIHPMLADALRAWREHPEAQGSEYVIPWKATQQALTGRVVYFLRNKCGIIEGGIHTLRRTFLTSLKRKDVDTGKMMRAAGQTTEKVTQGYVKLDVTDLREPIGRLDYEKAKDALNAANPGVIQGSE